jgi:glyoxylase-like metal-dependent hydrolase (beta-lactamase superfamily II)
MGGTNGLKETTLSVNVFTAPGKAMVGERPRPFGEALGFEPITSTLIFGEHDAVLVDAMMTVAEAEALADWVALHNRNLETIYITHAHFDLPATLCTTNAACTSATPPPRAGRIGSRRWTGWRR